MERRSVTRGKRTRLTPNLIADLARELGAGMPRGVAAARVGIGRTTLEYWLGVARTLREGPRDAARPCDTCGATGDDPCTTSTGRPARAPHAGRNTGKVPGGDPELFHDLLDAVEKAEADAHARNLAVIQRAGQDGTWQAAAWFLERRYPELYARRTLEVSGPGGGPIESRIEHTGLGEGVSTERLIELARRFDDDGDDDPAG